MAPVAGLHGSGVRLESAKSGLEKAFVMKKSIWIPLTLLVVLYVGFLAFVGSTAHRLPERLATHFNASGEPDGWMSRAGHVRFVLLVGSSISLFMIAICYPVRFLPAGLINIPNRDHWLTPERRPQADRILLHHSVWFACLCVTFMAALHYLVLQANQVVPPQLSVAAVLLVIGSFMVGILAWILTLLFRFRLPSPGGA